MQLDREIEYNEGVIADREQSLVEIEHAIQEVNEIFRDLGTLVSEQQGMIGMHDVQVMLTNIGCAALFLLFETLHNCHGNDTNYITDNIESNIESTATRTGDANIELQQADRYQRRARNRMCCLLLIVAIVMGVIILVVVLTH